MKEIRLTQLVSQHLPQAILLYENAFPFYERRPTTTWVQFIKQHSNFKALAILNSKNIFCGFITNWMFPTFVYIEHFAILSSIRSHGLGSQALETFITQYAPKPIVLEAELPLDEISQHRIAFYTRHGFSTIKHIYFQPGYEPNPQRLEMSLLCNNENWAANNFETIKQTLYRDVYGIKSHPN